MAQITRGWAVDTRRAGQFLVTPGVLDALGGDPAALRPLLARHLAGDWGNVDPEDAGLNDRALRTGARLLSVYRVADEVVWIITEAADDDGRRAATTVLLASEY